MKKFVVKTVVVLSVVAVAFVAFSKVIESLDEAADVVGEAISKNVIGSEDSKTSITNIDLEKQLAACSSLMTAQYAFSSECYYEEDGFFIFTGEECTFAYEGYVNAGIKDLSAVQVRINRENQLVEVYMPDVEILGDPVIDYSSIEVIDESTGWFSDITVEETAELFEQCCDHQINRAVEANILGEAKTQVRRLTEDFLGNFLSYTELADYKIAVLFGIEAPSECSLQVVDAVIQKNSFSGAY